MERFENRVEAGRRLGLRLATLAGPDVVVLGLPRGGVPVAAEVAKVLEAPLDVIVVRKLGLPTHPEVAMGAIGEDGVRVLNWDLIGRIGIAESAIARVEADERTVLEQRIGRLRRGRAGLDLTGRTAIIVDDGIATGATAQAACLVARQLGAARVIVAAPVGPPSAPDDVPGADEVICLIMPSTFSAVGYHYDDFRPTTDDEVADILALDASNPAADEVRQLARPLASADDLAPLVERLANQRFVGMGEASHGTHEFYTWRADLSRALIEQHGFRWIGVEGDWPDCWRINLWLRGEFEPQLDARGILARFERWPTWMWANAEVADFLDWLRGWNAEQPAGERVAFYGLDVYSLWDSLREIIGWLEKNEPDALAAGKRAWECFVPFREDPHEYAWSTRLVPASCETDVVALLTELRHRVTATDRTDDAAFDAVQNAEVAAGAERYYRTMVRGDRESWNVRDRHMADTVDRIAAHHGPHSKGMLWEHNTHIGDARHTDMARAGMVNVGQLLRERHGGEGVALVGFASYEGTVIAATGWGEIEEVFTVPPAVPNSHEQLIHDALRRDALFVFDEDRHGPWLSSWRGHRAIGVVYNPRRESGNFVPTRMGARYDALLWFETTVALRPLRHEPASHDPELETEPSGF